ncbi:hypothetical protein F511_06630 [Dorcoceras hygrometricum]|uniref:Uncharacterized protein n=1 Tax=Dorcoceras hygrometricum TaxID=472368 RepID=A0A2Z7ANX4_9LAMI|nr:hypothetical protein F511_06630 [Dorcoceras hygrometricum]
MAQKLSLGQSLDKLSSVLLWGINPKLCEGVYSSSTIILVLTMKGHTGLSANVLALPPLTVRYLCHKSL